MISVHAGEQLDHFQIERLVARSGMASIYQGTDLRTGQTVAIKIPHPEMECDPIFFERFQREEEIGKKLDHPGVMKVIANDERHDPYIVMEWVPGRLLRADHLRKSQDAAGARHQARAADLQGARPYSQPRRDSSRSEAGKHHGR